MMTFNIKKLKENITDDTLDLSICNLKDIPIKEIAAFPKVTVLDLSNNMLIKLGLSKVLLSCLRFKGDIKTFQKLKLLKAFEINKNAFSSSLTHLVKLDLGRNHIKELPVNFGLLVNLKHLDLYNNELEVLPLSFGNLRSLKWLDLKENPLKENWRKHIGPCITDEDCKFAARSAVKYAFNSSKNLEAELQRTEALQRQIEGEKLKELNKKKEKKERKKKKLAAKNAQLNQEILDNEEVAEVTPSAVIVPHPVTENNSNFKISVSILTGRLKFIMLLLCLMVLSVSVLKFINPNLYNQLMINFYSYARPITSHIPANVRISWHKWTLYLSTYTKYTIAFLRKLSIETIKILNGVYMFIITDPKFEEYLNLIIKSISLVYVRICEIVYFLTYQLYCVLYFLFTQTSQTIYDFIIR